MKKIVIFSFIFLIIISGGYYVLQQQKVTAQLSHPSRYATSHKDWQITFSEQMDPATFTNETVKIKNENNDTIPISFDWDDKFQTLTILAPEQGYSLDQTYELIISKQVVSITGKHLKSAYSHQFTALNDLPNIKDKEQLTQILKERRRRQMETVTVEYESSSMDSVSSGASFNDSSGSDSSYASSTNIQVKGIDEGDIVKTDGQFIYFSRDQDIIIMQADPNNSQIVSQISEKDFYPTELYVHHHLLISIGHSFQTLREADSEHQEDAVTLPFFNSHTTIYLYDISNPHEPTKIRDISIEGFMTATRKMDDYLFLVLNHYPPYHILEDTDIEARPFYMDTASKADSQPVDYENLYFFPDSHDESFLILASIDLNQPEQEVVIESYLGASDQLYMSKNHLYVATTQYIDDQTKRQSFDTMIARPANTKVYQFAVKDGGIVYNNSTKVNGTLINQFAMDESNGAFRIATTKGNMWDDANPSENNIYTFDLELNSLGAVEGLAKGEQIFSVRFMEDVAYMVTFKQVDPLFVVDLKDPSQPKVLGELKIPGFSNYLHPLDENHVIGFGQHTELMPNAGGQEPTVLINGIKVSVFDVTDPAQPKEKYSEIIGKGSSYTELNHNHKVLYQHPTENIFGFPAVIYDSKLVTRGDISYYEDIFTFEGALLYEITPNNGIQLIDTITHQEQIIQDPYFDWWQSHIVRLVSIGDVLYTLSYDKMNLYDLTHNKHMNTVDLPIQEY